jgi:hypothetical protein
VPVAWAYAHTADHPGPRHTANTVPFASTGLERSVELVDDALQAGASPLTVVTDSAFSWLFRAQCDGPNRYCDHVVDTFTTRVAARWLVPPTARTEWLPGSSLDGIATLFENDPDADAVTVPSASESSESVTVSLARNPEPVTVTRPPGGT